MKPKIVADLFGDRIILIPFSECWHWNRALDKNGYGLYKDKGKMRRAHRVSYEVANGILLHDHDVHHKCRNQACVNPAHLSMLNKKDHAAQIRTVPIRSVKMICPYGHAKRLSSSGVMYCADCTQTASLAWRRQKMLDPNYVLSLRERGRAAYKANPKPRKPKRTHCKRGHEFTEENTRIKLGARICRICSNEQAKWAYRKKASVHPSKYQVRCNSAEEVMYGSTESVSQSVQRHCQQQGSFLRTRH